MQASSSDAALDAAIAARLVATTAERAWKITSRPACGRYLVAARDLAAGEVVFAERPLIVATSTSDGERAMRGEMAAVALELLREPSDSPAHLLQEADLSADTECASMKTTVVVPFGRCSHAARVRCSLACASGSLAGGLRMWTLGVLRALKMRSKPLLRADGSAVHPTEDDVSWALGVASVNVHGRDDRGVLGLLASMMEHDCEPSCSTDVANSEAEGSGGETLVTLRTKRAVKAGESLSITYVVQGTPVHERRRQLRLQHGFVCACERCAAELAASGETSESGEWRHGWENRIARGGDPYSAAT